MTLDGPQRKGDLSRFLVQQQLISYQQHRCSKRIGTGYPRTERKLIGSAQRVPTPTEDQINPYSSKLRVKLQLTRSTKLSKQLLTNHSDTTQISIVSSDNLRNEIWFSVRCYTDSAFQQVMQIQRFRLYLWYDNENSYTSLRTIKHFGTLL